MGNRVVGSVFILVGSAIGAGMLALPLVSAATGFWHAFILLIVIWALMTLTALMILEVNLAFKPYRNSFGTMAKATLGRFGQIITWTAYLFLLYATTSSYIAGNASLLDQLFKHLFRISLPGWVNIIGFTLVFGSAVFLSTRTVDYFSRFLLSAKGVLLILMLTSLMPYVDVKKLIVQPESMQYIWVAAPIFLNAFGFHSVIPSVSNYCNGKARILKSVILLSSTIPLIVYSVWLFVSFGIVPLSGNVSFTTIARNGFFVGEFIHTLGVLVNNKYVWFSINGFSNIAMTTSFLGVGLGLFDFLADGFKRSNTRFGRLQTAFLAFTPPLFFALFYKNGFILALEYSAFFAIILEVFLPALMVYKLRRMTTLHSPYRVPINETLLLVLLSVIGIILMSIIISKQFELLPTLLG